MPTLNSGYNSAHPFVYLGIFNPFNILEAICVGYFSIEIIIRFIVWPGQIKYFTNPLNILDLISVIPYYFYLAYYEVPWMVTVKNACKVFRLLSMVKILRRWDAFNTMILTLRQSVKEIGMFLIYLSLNVLVFSTIVFYCEYTQDDTMFYSIPATFW
jgi:hypothetical protein